MAITKFKCLDYEKELKKELEMRRRVWRRIPGEESKFVDQMHQHRYDVMNEILIILKHADWKTLEALRARAEVFETPSAQGELKFTEAEVKLCNHSCGPGDFREGGKCDKMGCYQNQNL